MEISTYFDRLKEKILETYGPRWNVTINENESKDLDKAWQVVLGYDDMVPFWEGGGGTSMQLFAHARVMYKSKAITHDSRIQMVDIGSTLASFLDHLNIPGATSHKNLTVDTGWQSAQKTWGHHLTGASEYKIMWETYIKTSPQIHIEGYETENPPFIDPENSLPVSDIPNIISEVGWGPYTYGSVLQGGVTFSNEQHLVINANDGDLPSMIQRLHAGEWVGVANVYANGFYAKIQSVSQGTDFIITIDPSTLHYRHNVITGDTVLILGWESIERFDIDVNDGDV